MSGGGGGGERPGERPPEAKKEITEGDVTAAKAEFRGRIAGCREKADKFKNDENFNLKMAANNAIRELDSLEGKLSAPVLDSAMIRMNLDRIEKNLEEAQKQKEFKDAYDKFGGNKLRLRTVLKGIHDRNESLMESSLGDFLESNPLLSPEAIAKLRALTKQYIDRADQAYDQDEKLQTIFRTVLTPENFKNMENTIALSDPQDGKYHFSVENSAFFKESIDDKLHEEAINGMYALLTLDKGKYPDRWREYGSFEEKEDFKKTYGRFESQKVQLWTLLEGRRKKNEGQMKKTLAGILLSNPLLSPEGQARLQTMANTYLARANQAYDQNPDIRAILGTTLTLRNLDEKKDIIAMADLAVVNEKIDSIEQIISEEFGPKFQMERDAILAVDTAKDPKQCADFMDFRRIDRTTLDEYLKENRDITELNIKAAEEALRGGKTDEEKEELKGKLVSYEKALRENNDNTTQLEDLFRITNENLESLDKPLDSAKRALVLADFDSRFDGLRRKIEAISAETAEKPETPAAPPAAEEKYDHNYMAEVARLTGQGPDNVSKVLREMKPEEPATSAPVKIAREPGPKKEAA